MRYGYMPVIFHGTERQRYYDTLRHGPRQMEDFLQGMMMNYIDNAEKFIENELKEREKRSSVSAMNAWDRLAIYRKIRNADCEDYPLGSNGHPFEDLVCDLPFLDVGFEQFRRRETKQARLNSSDLCFASWAFASAPILEAFRRQSKPGSPSRLSLQTNHVSRIFQPLSSIRPR